MKSFETKLEINASAEKVWDALVNPRTIIKWSSSDAKMSDKENVDFSLWNGDIWGTNLKVIENKLLIQYWYSGKWDKPSKVEFSLTCVNDITTLKLKHDDIPDNEFNDIKAGWDEYYLGPLKLLLESALM